MRKQVFLLFVIMLAASASAQGFGTTKADCQAQAIIYQQAKPTLPTDGGNSVFQGVYTWKSSGWANYNGTVVAFIETGVAVADGLGHFCQWSHAVLLNQTAGGHPVSWDLYGAWNYNLSGFSGTMTSTWKGGDSGELFCNADGSHCHLLINVSQISPNWIWEDELTRN